MKAVIFDSSNKISVDNIIVTDVKFVQQYYGDKYLLVEDDLFVEPGMLYDSKTMAFRKNDE